MTPDENKAILRRALDEIWNKGNLAAADDVASPNFIVHTNMPGIPGHPDIEQMKQSVAIYRTAFPDLNTTFDAMVAEGDMIAVRFTAHGTHRGSLLGIAPTGKEATVANITIYRMAEGRIVEQWGMTDSLGLLRQLGIAPPLAAEG